MKGATVTRADLCESVHEQVGLTRQDSSELVERVLELMCQALRILTTELQRTVPESRLTSVLQLATAAVTVAIVGGSCVIGTIFWQRIRDLYNL